MNSIFSGIVGSIAKSSAANAVVDRLRERQTWRGFVIGIAGFFGFYLNPDAVEVWTALAAGAWGVIDFTFRENGQLRN